MNTQNRINIIKGQLNVKNNAYKFQETKKEVINFYSEDINKLNEVSNSLFNNYNFLKEVLNKCELKERKSIIKKLHKKVYRLERHTYAPELNKLHFKSLLNNKLIEVPTPKEVSINNALNYITVSMLAKDLKELLKTTNTIK